MDRWLVLDRSQVLTVMLTKFIARAMISSEGNVMSPYFFEKGLKITAEVYLKVVQNVVVLWIKKVLLAVISPSKKAEHLLVMRRKLRRGFLRMFRSFGRRKS